MNPWLAMELYEARRAEVRRRVELVVQATDGAAISAHRGAWRRLALAAWPGSRNRRSVRGEGAEALLAVYVPARR